MVLGILPYGSQQVLNGGARGRLGQQFTQALLDIGRDHAGAQKRGHALQLRDHESLDHAATLVHRHAAGAAAIGLIQPPRHHDLAPQGHPLLVDHLLESIPLTVVYHGVVTHFTSLSQALETASTDVVQTRSKLSQHQAKCIRSCMSGLQAMFPLPDIFLQFCQASAQIVRIFHLGPLSGFWA